jgi:hypothetical protein
MVEKRRLYVSKSKGLSLEQIYLIPHPCHQGNWFLEWKMSHVSSPGFVDSASRKQLFTFRCHQQEVRKCILDMNSWIPLQSHVIAVTSVSLWINWRSWDRIARVRWQGNLKKHVKITISWVQQLRQIQKLKLKITRTARNRINCLKMTRLAFFPLLSLLC